MEEVLETCPCIGCYWNDKCHDPCNSLRLWAIDQPYDYAPESYEFLTDTAT